MRKAGGVYYTPEYIVRYITENTVGKLIEGKTPAEISEMRFADIACGSGSFLLGVYDLLLRYHTAYYNLSGKRPKPAPPGTSSAPTARFNCQSHSAARFCKTTSTAWTLTRRRSKWRSFHSF